jgi:hypothetical protein
MSEVATLIEDDSIEEDIEKLDAATEMLAKEGSKSCIEDAIDSNVVALAGIDDLSTMIVLEVELTSKLIVELDSNGEGFVGSMERGELSIGIEDDVRAGTEVVAEDAIESSDVVETLASDDAASTELESDLEAELGITDAGLLGTTVGALNRLDPMLESLVVGELALVVDTAMAIVELLIDSIDENETIFESDGRLDSAV